MATGKSTPPLVTNPADPLFTDPVVFSPDGKTVAAASARTVNLWNSSGGKLVGTFEKPANVVVSLVFSPNGKSLAAYCSPGEVTLWSVASRKITATLKAGLPLLAFSPRRQDARHRRRGFPDFPVRYGRQMNAR